MDRRRFVRLIGLGTAGALTSCVQRREHDDTVGDSDGEVDPKLRLFVDRKESLAGCIRGYLLTQATGELQPKTACYVLEKPVAGNIPEISAIPAGTYPTRVRVDGPRGWRLELDNVPGHEHIQIHVGNYPADTKGCLLPGTGAPAGQCAVTGSQAAMQMLKTLFTVFGTDGQTTLTIRDA
jgi:hypothetical protein